MPERFMENIYYQYFQIKWISQRLILGVGDELYALHEKKSEIVILLNSTDFYIMVITQFDIWEFLQNVSLLFSRFYNTHKNLVKIYSSIKEIKFCLHFELIVFLAIIIIFIMLALSFDKYK